MTTRNTPSPFTQCPVCGSANLSENWEVQTFPACQDGPEDVSARVPMMHCAACGFAFTDHRAEAIRHDATCRRLGLLTPDEIRHIREGIYGMSRKAFAEAFKFGEASLERWENRKLFQNPQADVLLRLLKDQHIGRRILSWTDPPPSSSADAGVVDLAKFRALRPTSDMQERGRHFFSDRQKQA